ncbi:MAG TPA: DeoR/GlpR family DNA-binding transcription regulator [Rectinemataceae bacterium]|nr:DeoR/GlpR family DNA-binding transcription regulator [Rectinemataceae bacterium]
MIRERRFERIREELARQGSLEGEELAALLGISKATLRRDLDELERRGVLKRTHGGATLPASGAELPYFSKLAAFAAEKRAIGAAAAALIPEGAVIGCTGGTTVMQVIKSLSGKSLTIVTNAINIAMELAHEERIQVVVTGGSLRPRSFELVGPHSDQLLSSLRLDIALIGVDGISPEFGISTYTLGEAHSNSQFISRAEKVWVVADHSKVGKVAPALIAPLSKVQRIITDADIGEEARGPLASAGVEVVLAERQEP